MSLPPRRLARRWSVLVAAVLLATSLAFTIANGAVGIRAAVRPTALPPLRRAAVFTTCSTSLDAMSPCGGTINVAANVTGSRRTGHFVSFNVCAIPETMLETSLFGHVRGAYTGATRDAPGYLVEADQGTAFFDEISGLPLVAQSKLLRAIELREFRPVGATRDRRSAFRVVAATNEDLDELIDVGRFRADLLHRLRGIAISIPPLASRREDIPELVRYFLANESRGDTPMTITERALSLLQDHHWPGNVRELRQVMGRIAALTDAPAITADEVLAALFQGRSQASPVSGQPTPMIDDAAAFRRVLLAVLDGCDGDTLAVAAHFRVSRPTVYRWLKQLGIATPKRRHSTASIASAPHSQPERAIPA